MEQKTCRTCVFMELRKGRLWCPYCGRQHGSKHSMRLYRPENMECLRCRRVFGVERCENDEYITHVRPFECEYTPEIVCPYCGYRYRDSWAVSADMRDGDEDGLQCNRCGKDFTFALNLSVTYSTRKQEVE